MKKIIILILFIILSVYQLKSQWFLQVSGTNSRLFSTSFVDVNFGWTVSADHIYKTSNGGTNWYEIGTSDYQWEFYKVLFVNQNTGWVLFVKYMPPPQVYSRIMKTTDGGATWFQQEYYVNTGLGSA